MHVHVAELVEDGGQALLGHGGGVVAALELVQVEVGRVHGRRHCAVPLSSGRRELVLLAALFFPLLYRRAESEKKTRAR